MSVRVGIKVDAGTTAAWLVGNLPRLVESAVTRTVHLYGALLQTQVRKNASTGYHPPRRGHIPGTGPGPNVATGDYRRTVTLTTSQGGGQAAAVVSSNAPQAWRLERGFIGTDSRGRRYRQPAYPHWGPAVDTIEPRFLAALDKVTQDAVSAADARGIATTGRATGSILRP